MPFDETAQKQAYSFATKRHCLFPTLEPCRNYIKLFITEQTAKLDNSAKLYGHSEHKQTGNTKNNCDPQIDRKRSVINI
jgi:hypothetical protein